MITSTRRPHAVQSDGRNNNRIIIATYGNKAILDHEGVREEWVETDAKGHHVLVVDGKSYEYKSNAVLATA